MGSYKNGAQYLRWKARKKKVRERVAKLRAERDARKECRACGAPAVRSKYTGKLTKACRKHLREDKDRKDT